MNNPKFQKELEKLLNTYSIDNELNTSDRVLAIYLMECLDDFSDFVDLKSK